MRMVIGQLLAVVRRYPALVDGAFVIIAWVGIKLLIEYLHLEGHIHFQVNKWMSFGLIVLIIMGSLAAGLVALGVGSLASYGLKEDDILPIVQASRGGSMRFNPIELTDDATELFTENNK